MDKNILLSHYKKNFAKTAFFSTFHSITTICFVDIGFLSTNAAFYLEFLSEYLLNRKFTSNYFFQIAHFTLDNFT